MAADGGEHLYQQNHCGVYRSDRRRRARGRRSRPGSRREFGFPMAAHPRDPQTVWTIPLNGAEQGRLVPGRAARPSGARTTAATRGSGPATGLPQHDAYLEVLREAMAVDRLDPVGVYFGTSTGQLYGSADEGRSWSLIADNLPPIWSVEAVAVG